MIVHALLLPKTINVKLKPLFMIVLPLFTQHAAHARPLDIARELAVNEALQAKKIQAVDNSDNYGRAPLNISPESIRNIIVADTEANGSLLSISSEDEGGTPNTEQEYLPLDFETPQVKVRAKRYYEIGPLPGLGLTKDEIPGNVQSITAKDIKESHSVSMTDLFSKKLQSVTVNDYQGNPFQMDIQYRGFTAGPQIGTPQGLSVFLDGVRVNEPFGDVVNWDMMPMNAISRVDVFPGSNPVFGLNTLGGAFTLKTKDGFNDTGMDVQLLSGSYGRDQLQAEGGWNNGKIAVFGAGSFFMEDGWRDDSPSEVNQFFGKASYRGEALDLSLSTLLVSTDLVGNGLLPSEEYAQDRNGSFTSEDTTENSLQQFQLSSAFQVKDSFSITGQVYRRQSNRHQTGADVFTDWPDERAAVREPAAGEEFTCLFKNTNEHGYKIPDYIVVPVNLTTGPPGGLFGSDFFNQYFDVPNFGANPGTVDLSGLNPELPDDFVAAFEETFERGAAWYANGHLSQTYTAVNPPEGPTVAYTTGSEHSYDVNFAAYNTYGALNKVIFPNDPINFTVGSNTFYYKVNADNEVIKNYVFILSAINVDSCQPASALVNSNGTNTYPYVLYDGALPQLIDGSYYGQSGTVEGTPTAVITENDIEQLVIGASIQFNWNLDQHKFMLGASIDDASATYSNEQRFGMLDANRKAYLAPDEISPIFAAATIPLSNNDFSGTNITQSLYFSETWSPVEAWNFNASARYNTTQAQNEIAARYGSFAYGLGSFLNAPYGQALCTSDEDCDNTELNYRSPLDIDTLDPGETEKFSYYSFNPSLGATWQAKENLNIYANWARGARVPSVIELGCAFDDTPVNAPGGLVAKSIAENRSCSLPNTLSGDPYLEQIRSTSYDIGLRGNIGNDMQWNLGAYQTDLEDDIYFIAVGAGLGFFDNIGKTRRRGLEAGLSGRSGKFSFGVNYSLTDATFQDKFVMLADDNNSGTHSDYYGGYVIEVNKGDRMPGVSLHNLNANVGYQITSKWHVGLSAVMHSESFVRGNENNKHQPGVAQERVITVETSPGVYELVSVNRQISTNPGKLPGYATFNFQSSYQFSKAWTATLLVNNILDKEFFSAGRLGRNPFSPSIQGAVGPYGYNHNSNDWLSTNFIAPSAPRGIWLNVNWQFD